MVLEFNIPNGTMKIHVDTFFQEARLSKIQKMLKMFQGSFPTLDQVEEIRNWLQEGVLEERHRQKEKGNGNGYVRLNLKKRRGWSGDIRVFFRT